MSKIIITAVISFVAGFILAKNIDWNSAADGDQTLALKQVKKKLPQENSLDSIKDKSKTDTVSVPDQIVKDSSSNTKKRLFNDDKGVQVEFLLNEKIESGEVQSESQAPNEGKFTKEKLADGSIVNREYDSEGKLIGESKQYEDSEVKKSFFDNGQIKGAKMKFADGSTTSILYDFSGTITTRKDELSNGDYIAWEFNDYGEVRRRWLIRKNQKPVLID